MLRLKECQKFQEKRIPKKKDMQKITNDLLFKYFSGKASESEKSNISNWLKESAEHRRIYGNARDIYSSWLINAPMETIEKLDKAEEKPRRRKIWTILGTAAGFAATVAVCCVSVYMLTQQYFENRLAATMNTIVVPAGKNMDFTLSDGTVIKLNSCAKLQYPMVFAKDSREVRLDGEAYFKVAHNEKQPFTVRTFATDITVLGTEFNVNADEAKNIFSATLVEGRIKLRDLDGKEIYMNPEQTTTLTENGMVTGNDPDRPISWINGILDINTRDFRELMEKLETAYGVEIVIDSETLPEFNCARGKFRISDGIDQALQVLQDMIEFNYTKDYRSGTIHIRAD